MRAGLSPTQNTNTAVRIHIAAGPADNRCRGARCRGGLSQEMQGVGNKQRLVLPLRW